MLHNFEVVGFRYGVYTSMVIRSTWSMIKIDASAKGFTEIFEIEEV